MKFYKKLHHKLNIFVIISMKKVVKFLKENKLFLFFLFVFSWLFILKNALRASKSLENLSFHIDAPFWFFFKSIFIFLLVTFIKKRISGNAQLKISIEKKYMLFFGVGLLCYLVYSNLLGLLMAYVFNTFSRNFGNLYLVVYNNFGLIIDFLIFGGFSLAYLYFKENKKYQEQVNDYEISKVKNEIAQLRTQLNPHFLFNNLNVLDHLIEEDSEKASSFLNHFSELYRYNLFTANKELVSLEDELTFSEGYFGLMKVKYNDYYNLTIEEELKSLKAILPPFCIQVLVENAITHNRGTVEKPISIKIKAVEKGIKISNNKVAFKNRKKGNGIALENIIKQFHFFAKKSILIEENENDFEVTLPLINLK